VSNFPIDEPFDLPVAYKGDDILFPSRLVKFGYQYAIHVDVYGQQLIIERDEEGQFRAMLQQPSQKSLPHDLIRAIMDAVEKHLG
jgi:hypothetical protein